MYSTRKGEDVSHITQATWFYAVISRILTGFVWGNVFEMELHGYLRYFDHQLWQTTPCVLSGPRFETFPNRVRGLCNLPCCYLLQAVLRKSVLSVTTA
jgi:hypothetical protein